MYRTGYCCINLTIGDNFKTMRLGWADKNKEEVVRNKWKEVINHNFSLLYKIIAWNINNNVYLYRISSDLIPFADHPKWGEMWEEWRGNIENYAVLGPVRQMISRYRSLGGRLTIHPSQFVSIGSMKESVRNNSILNLNYHGLLLDLLGLPESYDTPINIHVSNGSADSKIIINNVEDSINKLPNNVIKRLVFENEDKGYWTVENLRTAFPEIPITFDYHHHRINNNISEQEAIKIAAESWSNNDPLQHYSEGRAHRTDRSHSDYVKSIPITEYDLEIEAKKKDLAIKDFLSNRNKYIPNIIY